METDYQGKVIETIKDYKKWVIYRTNTDISAVNLPLSLSSLERLIKEIK